MKWSEEKDLTEEQVQAFLADLSELSRKHRVIIGGCGCCGSPFISSMDAEGHYKLGRDSYYEYPAGLQWAKK
jgi:hypothetical protein